MRIRIVSDGTPKNTQVFNAETGERIRGVQGIKWELGGKDGMATATIDFVLVGVDVVAGIEEEPSANG